MITKICAVLVLLDQTVVRATSMKALETIGLAQVDEEPEPETCICYDEDGDYTCECTETDDDHDEDED